MQKDQNKILEFIKNDCLLWHCVVFEVPILDLDPPFVKHVEKLMAHPVFILFWRYQWFKCMYKILWPWAPVVNFINIFCVRFLYESAFVAKTKLEKSSAKHFCTKNVRVKCWWNWHLLAPFNVIYFEGKNGYPKIVLSLGHNSFSQVTKMYPKLMLQALKQYSSVVQPSCQ